MINNDLYCKEDNRRSPNQSYQSLTRPKEKTTTIQIQGTWWSKSKVIYMEHASHPKPKVSEKGVTGRRRNWNMEEIFTHGVSRGTRTEKGFSSETNEQRTTNNKPWTISHPTPLSPVLLKDTRKRSESESVWDIETQILTSKESLA